MQNLYLIAAISADGGLGKDNDLLWHFKQDMRFFRQTTMNHVVVMGGNTFRSLGSKPLPKRENLVLTRSQVEDPNVQTFTSLEALKEHLTGLNQPIYVIGGASLYQAFLPEAEKLYLTEVQASCPADVYFPDFDRSQYNREVLETGVEDGIKFEICVYTRKH